MPDTPCPNRRVFLKTIGMAGAALPAGVGGAQAPAGAQPAAPPPPGAAPVESAASRKVAWPRTFTGRQLTRIAFPLGGVATGTISLGGRGQLTDWEIYNRPDKGNVPEYAFASLRVQREGRPAVSRVLESRLQPPYEGSSGLGSRNVPGLPRFESAEFTGEYPFARIAFRDRKVPVRASLEAFSPFIPHEPDDSGLPIAVLRYRLANPAAVPVTASIAWSVQNPFVSLEPADRSQPDTRLAEPRDHPRLHGLLLTNRGLPAAAPLAGSFVVGVLDAGGGQVTRRRWERSGWWTSVLHFWDDFTGDGALDPESSSSGPVATVCLQRTIAPGASADFTFMLAWHVPNRTPARCGWTAPPGDEQVVIGNHYCTRFDDAWSAAVHAAERLERLEAKTRTFVAAVRSSTLPGAVKDAAMSNLSTLATQTCFRTADGEFHAFEGSNDTSGCCTGNCTHVWNYETATAHLFPSFSRSLRRSAFGYSLDDDGAMHFRQMLPDGKARSGFAAADGQMGQIVKVYMDWRLSGDDGLLADLFPKAWKALAFAWVEGGWDADKDGVLEGAQHNTYDVEFYGPNPQCGIYYLAALRAVEEMALAVGDGSKARQARELFERGRAWIDEHLWNGEYYVQQVKGMPRASIHKALLSSMGSADSEQPQYQVGEGCLADQLIGQYLAEVAGLGAVVDPARARTALASIFKYNFKRHLEEHAGLQRTYVVNDESALIICDYGKGERPAVPFPYYAEAWTGMEYSSAATMIYAGLVREGLECIESARARYDGERRNPWNEPECGHHYARAMSAWSAVLALSGFRYHGGTRHVSVQPRLFSPRVRSFWATGTGWGEFELGPVAGAFGLRVLHGALPCRTIALPPRRTFPATARIGDAAMPFRAEREDGGATLVRFDDELRLGEGQMLSIG
jgi:uncharacterized protein (DUF608 family)